MPQPTETVLPLTAPDADIQADTRLEPLPTPCRRQPPRNYQLCRHIRTAGNRCGSPALRGEPFCYYHHTTRRPPKHLGVHPDHAVFTMPLLEDAPSILSALQDVLARVAANSLNHRRAALLLCGLRIACITQRLAIPQAPAAPAASASEEDSPAAEDPTLALLQDIILDPDLGPLAPIAHAEFPKPPAPEPPEQSPPAQAPPAPQNLGRYEPEPPEPGRTEPGYSQEHMDRILRRLGFPHVPRPSDPAPPTSPADSTPDYFGLNSNSPAHSVIPTIQAVADDLWQYGWCSGRILKHEGVG